MFELERGPIDLGDLPLPPRVAYDGLFGSHATDFVEARQGVAITLDLASNDVAGDGIPDEDGAHYSILGAAEATTDEETHTPDEAVPDAVYVAGANVNVRAAQSTPYLPDADSDVPTSFADPPQPPRDGWQGGGGGGDTSSDNDGQLLDNGYPTP